VKRSSGVPLSGYTTLRMGGPAQVLAEATTVDEAVGLVRDADRSGQPLLVLGGGSNLVIADSGFPGTVVRVATRGVASQNAADGRPDVVRVTAAAGENWDDLVDWAVAEKLAGIECLAGIPGLVGATPIQNVGAYGQEVASVIESVGVFDRASGGSIARLTGASCGFGYRTSRFKAEPERFVVLEVTLELRRDPMSVAVGYPELARTLGIAVGESAPVGDVRDAVLGLRRGKGMVLDPADPDTASAGSFFTNPVLDADQLAILQGHAAVRAPGVAVPTFPAGPGRVKVPAAWLIEHSGFGRGYPGSGPARISSKHTLALTNRGGATTAEVIALARQIVAGVRTAFGVELVTEPVLIGVTL
jgi:UDP-N-acetylmuramate dehydrogenase